MVELNANDVDCLVFTYKEGLLSKVAHDLRIRVTKLQLDVEPDGDGDEVAVKATFDARSLRVDTALKDGRETPRALSAGDRRKIEKNIVKDVLNASRYPTITFEGHGARISTSMDGGGYLVEGELALHGRRRRLEIPLHRDGDRLVAETELDQTHFGIKPYSALLGTLKIKPRVTLRIDVPASRVEP